MQITVTKGEVSIYQQLLEDSSTLNHTVSHLMQQVQGENFITKIVNNGHVLTFRNQNLNIEKLVRRVNGIVTRTTRGAT